MKKLMLAAAIVCAAAISHGATCYWKAATAYNQQLYTGNTTDKYTGTAYLIWAGQSITVGGEPTTINQQYILDHKGDVASIASQIGKDLAVQSGTKAGQIATTAVWSDGLNTSDPAVATTRQYFLAIVDGDNVFVSADSANVNESFNTSGQSISMSLKTQSQTSKTGTTFAGGGWYAVPEPTSGLLLLIGMAGLALRRRRA